MSDTKKLSKDEIYRALKKQHPTESDKTIREVSYNLALASVTSETLVDKAKSAIGRIQQAPQNNPLSQAKFQVKAGHEPCPICKFEMKAVKLLEDKSAWYCPDHKIVVPSAVEE